MSIYATLWFLKFPCDSTRYEGCEWAEVVAQGVPGHIGTPTPGHGDEQGDPYASFLPPAIRIPADDDEDAHSPMRAVVFVKRGTSKGTDRSGQEYVNPLLVMSGQEYAETPFNTLYDRICESLCGDRPRCRSERFLPGGRVELTFSDGSTRVVDVER